MPADSIEALLKSDHDALAVTFEWSVAEPTTEPAGPATAPESGGTGSSIPSGTTALPATGSSNLLPLGLVLVVSVAAVTAVRDLTVSETRGRRRRAVGRWAEHRTQSGRRRGLSGRDRW